jgi:8-oxo-dGTP pyrophosphatase MutT (NUDIX family)
MASQTGMIYQAAAIPVRDGKLCIVRSSSGKRWIVPKGCQEPGMTLSEIALMEAWEEAGLVGVLNPEPVGSYLYDKWGATCHVTVYLMGVTDSAEAYPEAMIRDRAWVTPALAMLRIRDAGLRAVLRKVLREERIAVEV